MELFYVRDPPIGTRADFWRRFLTYLIDIIIVWMPIQIIAALLFATTSGWIQGTGGVTYTSCVTGPQMPESLDPPPPAGSNFARECHVYFFGAETARYVQVGRSTREGSSTTAVWRIYMLDREGHPIKACRSIGSQ
jgi:hypothetical protein